jgi:predicted amidohydrolase YtcJ
MFRKAGPISDMVILSADYLHAPVDKIPQIVPLVTMVGGNVVFKKNDSIIH